MAKRLTRDERKARTRAELIDAAAQVVGRKGYHAATVDDIAAEAGFTKGAFYSNFESKEDVFMELVADRSRNWTIAVARAYEGTEPLPDRLQKGGEVLTRMVQEQVDWMLLSSEMLSQCVRDPRMRERLAAAYEECRQVIARVVDRVETDFGVRLATPSDQVATMMMAMTDGFVYQRLADPDRLPADLLADGINVFLNGLLAVAGVGPVHPDA
ncbi:MAG TPA: TetR/AcrR family transcriptional regulator [Candidatus Dormibacteraeota bacterium]